MPGIGFRLQEASDHINVPDGHGSCFILKADELLVVLGKAVAKFFPPALLSRILGEREKEFAAGPGDLVVVEQPRDFPGPQAGPGPFVPADLGGRPLQRGGDRIPALAPALPDRTQFSGQPAAPHRGASWGDQWASLLGAARVR
jgi:hypothetical protein